MRNENKYIEIIKNSNKERDSPQHKINHLQLIYSASRVSVLQRGDLMHYDLDRHLVNVVYVICDELKGIHLISKSRISCS